MKPLDLSLNARWRERFRAADIRLAVTAQQNPDRGLVCTNKDGIYQLYAWDVPTGDLVQVTREPAGVLWGIISSDGNDIYFLKDEGGSEIGHYFRVPFTGGEAEDITPEMPPYSSLFISQNRRGNLTGFMVNDQNSFNAYVKKEGNAPQLLYQSEYLCAGPNFSCDGKFAVIESTDRSRTIDVSLLAFDMETGQQIGELWQENASMEYELFSPLAGDARLVCTSSASGFERPMIWDVSTGEQLSLQLDDIPGSIFPYAWSDDAEQLLLCQLYQAQFRLYRYEVRTHTVIRLDHPVGTLGFWWGLGFFAPDGDVWVIWEDFAHPPRLIALDGGTGVFKRDVLKAGDVPEGKAFRSVTLTSEKGDPIQGWLAVPDGEGPFPVVLETHGGPTSVRSPRFSPWGQCWLDHGFAYFTLNYHGSITFGKDFEKSIWGNLGELEVQDMATVYHWLVEQGIARPDAIMPTGESYGGFLTLLSLGRCPELWAGGMAEIAIADWVLMYEDQSESLRGYERALFGGTPDEVPEAMRKSSPITYAEQVRAPVLIIQGENDTRTPARQIKVYEEKMRSLGKQIEVHWFNAGHGSYAQEQKMEQQEIKLRFAYRVLG
ncbi:MAG: prolyl oligopeptidase family serine peptidase [Bacteroidota bacterium]